MICWQPEKANNLPTDWGSWWPCEGYTCWLGFLLHALNMLLASNLHKQLSQSLSRYQCSVLQECSALSLFLVVSANEEQKASGFVGAHRISCLLPKDLLDAFSVTNRTLRELLLSELQESSLIRPLIDRRNSRTPSMLRFSLQRQAVDTLETVNDIMNESWAQRLVKWLFLHPAAGAGMSCLWHCTEFNLTCSTPGHIQRLGRGELINLRIRVIKKNKWHLVSLLWLIDWNWSHKHFFIY